VQQESPALEKPGSAAASNRADPSALWKTVSEVEIMVLANQKWADAGRPKGDGHRFWVEAEQELDNID
jgi:hypothetical protein